MRYDENLNITFSPVATELYMNFLLLNILFYQLLLYFFSYYFKYQENFVLN